MDMFDTGSGGFLVRPSQVIYLSLNIQFLELCYHYLHSFILDTIIIDFKFLFCDFAKSYYRTFGN